MDVAEVLQAEIARLQRELEADPRYQTLRDLRAALAHYAPVSDAGHLGDPPILGSQARYNSLTGRRMTHLGRRRHPDRVKALDVAERYLEGRTILTPIGELYDAVVAEGVELGGKSPKGNFSAMLYRDDRFRSQGRDGWILAKNDFAGRAGATTSTPNEASDGRTSDASQVGVLDESSGIDDDLPPPPFNPASR